MDSRGVGGHGAVVIHGIRMTEPGRGGPKVSGRHAPALFLTGFVFGAHIVARIVYPFQMATRQSITVDVGDLQPGQTRPVNVDNKKLLLVRTEQGFHAIDAICPHYQMPLNGSIVCQGTIRCPWHQSVFDLASGHANEPPAPHGLGVYPVAARGNSVTITLTPSPPTTPAKVAANEAIVLLGSGAAASAAAIELRHLGFDGSIRMVSNDPHPPYDRPNLSKEFLSGETAANQLPINPGESWNDLQVIRLHRQVVGIDPAQKRLRCDDGSTVPFDQLLIASGGRAKTLQVPGPVNASNLFTLRTLDDAHRIIERSRHCRRVVVVGSSFIAMETAAALRQRGLAVMVVSPDAEPFERVLGKRVGAYLRRLHQRHGNRFRMKSNIAHFTGHSQVEGVVLDSGERLPADLVIVGIGVKPATDFLPDQWRDPDGGIGVDGSLRVAPDIFAAGDIARYPEARLGKPVRIEHWRVAEQQGRHAARAMLGDGSPFTSVPYFWSYQFGMGLDYVGHADRWDELVFEGDESTGDFVQYFIEKGQVIAAVMVGRSKPAGAMLQWMQQVGNPPAAMVFRPVDWLDELAKIERQPG